MAGEYVKLTPEEEKIEAAMQQDAAGAQAAAALADPLEAVKYGLLVIQKELGENITFCVKYGEAIPRHVAASYSETVNALAALRAKMEV